VMEVGLGVTICSAPGECLRTFEELQKQDEQVCRQISENHAAHLARMRVVSSKSLFRPNTQW